MHPSPFVHNPHRDRRFFVFDMFETLLSNKLGTVEPIFERLCTYYPGVRPSDISSCYHGLSRRFKETHSNMELSIDVLIRHLDGEFGFENDPASMEEPLLVETGIYGLADGADDALAYLKDNGYRIAVLSNTRYHSRTLRRMLELEGISEHVDEVVASADIGFRKPRQEAYKIVADSLGAEPSKCFFCGDNIDKDYYGPLAAGYAGAVHIDTAGDSRASYTVRSIGDLPDLFGTR